MARLLLIILLFSVKISIAQNNSFTKNYEVWNEFEMHDFQQTSDGGYIISSDAMYEMDPITNLGKGFLIKMDNIGATQWIKEYIKTGASVKPADGCSVYQCTDAGYIVAGCLYDTNGNARIRLFRTDASGNLLWSKIYPGLGLSSAYCVKQTSDGGYVVAGSTADPNSTITNGYLLKTNANGIPQFGKVLADPNGYSGVAYAVKQLTNGSYAYCGSSAFCPLIGILDALGNSVWNKILFNNYYGEFYDVIQNANGDLTFTGEMANSAGNTDLALVHYNTAGNSIWEKYYSLTNINSPYTYDEGCSLKETSTGEMVASFGSDIGSGMILFNSAGNIVWSRLYSNYLSYGFSTVESTTGNAYAFISVLGWNIVSVVKTDPSGHTSCHDSDVVFISEQIANTLVSNLTFTDSMPSLIDNLILINRILNENDSCVTDSTLYYPPPAPVPCETFFFVPNVFSPNGDHMNDVFRDSVVTCDPEYKMIIYDRWGTLVFESRVNTHHWDGTTPNGENASEGTYYYVLSTKEKTFKGFLTLLR